MAAFRAGNGRFVPRDNPIAIIGRANAVRALEEARRREREARAALVRTELAYSTHTSV